MNCVVCSKRAYSEYCVRHKPRAKIPIRKPIKQNGKTKKEWLSVRSGWLKNNLPDYRGYYQCHYCGKQVDFSAVTLDHKIPRSRAPELRYDHDNLVPCCAKCNRLKGSVAHDEYAHVCHT